MEVGPVTDGGEVAMALHELTVPKLGAYMSEATVLEWKAKEGEWVEKGTIVLEIETEKIKYAIEAEASGFLHILVQEGSSVPVGTVLGIIAETREEFEALGRERREEARGGQERERIFITPLARRLAEEHMIDVTKVKGTGPQGRITKEDIERAIREREQAAPIKEKILEKRVKATIPLKGMRKTIAERMHRSLSEAAQVTAFGEIDAFELVRLRQALLAAEQDLRITYTDILVFAASRALREMPIVNSSIVGDEIKIWEDINVGVAVALEDGLIVPVIKNADLKSLREIAKAIRDLVSRARGGRLNVDEVTGGTFTITNLGALGAGWRFETAIINPAESAILSVGGITERACVREGQIVARPIMAYSFTYDHRVIDGATALKFMSILTRLLENPTLLLF
jgi:pyruvate/2-oxoglutarate dehydrogenase complex dihydrolipoamide acyltransferase (E2) component